GGERSRRETRRLDVVEAHDGYLIRNCDAALEQGVERPERHQVTGRHDGIEGHVTFVDQRAYGGAAGRRLEVALNDQIRVDAQAVRRQNVAVSRAAFLGFTVTFWSPNEGDAAAPAFFEQVQQRLAYPCMVVDGHAWCIG